MDKLRTQAKLIMQQQKKEKTEHLEWVLAFISVFLAGIVIGAAGYKVIFIG
jgi:hypothetical protein